MTKEVKEVPKHSYLILYVLRVHRFIFRDDSSASTALAIGELDVLHTGCEVADFVRQGDRRGFVI